MTSKSGSSKKILPISVDLDLKDAFQKACDGNDQNASQVLRNFMREYVKKHSQMSLLKS